MNSPILCIVFVAVLALISASPVAKEVDKRQSGGSGPCYVQGGPYAHGTAVSFPGKLRCLTYRCNNGIVETVVKACDHKEECRPINSSYEVDCKTYTCTMVVKHGMEYYQVENTKSQCRDHNGKCHGNGAVFPYIHTNAREYTCTCIDYGNGTTTSKCLGK